MNSKIIIIILLFFGLGLYFLVIHSSKKDDPNFLKVSGNIEVTEVRASFKIGGRLEKRDVSEGETIKQGQVLAWLESSSLKQDIEKKRAEVHAKEAVLKELQTGYRPEEIAQAKAQVEQALAEFHRQRSDFERQQQLFKEEVISRKEFESIQAAYRVSKEKLVEAKERWLLLDKGYRSETIDQAQADLQAAKSALILAEIQLGYATLYSPLSGYVLSENSESGEVVAPGTPIVTLADLSSVWLKAYVDEPDLGKVHLGQEVEVTIDSFPDKVYKGTISFISSQEEFTPKNIQTEKERVKLVYRIKIDLPNPSLELKPGMPADGRIALSSKEE